MSYDKLDVLSFYLSKGHKVIVKMQIAVEILNQRIWSGLGVWNWSYIYVHSLYTEVQSDPKPQSQLMRFTVIPHNTMVKHLWFAVNYGNWKLSPEIYQPADLHQAASFWSFRFLICKIGSTSILRLNRRCLWGNVYQNVWHTACM